MEVPEGLTVTVSPSTIEVPANGSASFEVTIEATGAAPDTYHFAQLRLVNGDTVVESPIAVQPTSLAVPAEVSGDTTDGSTSYTGITGYDGTVEADVAGLLASDVTVAEVISDGPGGGEYLDDYWLDLEVPAGTDVLRVSIHDSEISVPDTDMDLYLVNPDFQIVAQSAVGGSDESITFDAPAPGDYGLAVDYWNGAAGDSAQVPIHVWMLSDTDEGNLTVSPESADATVGGTVDYTVAWEALAAGTRYFGAVHYTDGTDPVGRTLVSVHPAGAVDSQ